MKKTIYILILTLLPHLIFSQIPFPEVFCNGKSVKGDSIESFFLPVNLEFKFQNQDTIYVVREGKVEFSTYYNSKDYSVSLNSNSAYTNKVALGSSVLITINKIEVWKNSTLIKIDSIFLSKRIFIKRVSPLNIEEAKFINENSGILEINGKIFKNDKKYHFKSDDIFKVNLSKTESSKLKEFEVVLARGFRPVSVKKYSVLEFDFFLQISEKR